MQGMTACIIASRPNRIDSCEEDVGDSLASIPIPKGRNSTVTLFVSENLAHHALNTNRIRAAQGVRSEFTRNWTLSVGSQSYTRNVQYGSFLLDAATVGENH